MISFSQPWKGSLHRGPDTWNFLNSSVPAEVPKLWGLFRPPLRHRWVFPKHGRNTVRTWTTLKGNHASQRLDFHVNVKYIKQHFSELNKTIQNPSSNTRLYKPSENSPNAPHHQGLFVGRFPTTPTIHKFPPISQFGLGCLDLFRFKASLIISRACRGAPRRQQIRIRGRKDPGSPVLLDSKKRRFCWQQGKKLMTSRMHQTSRGTNNKLRRNSPFKEKGQISQTSNLLNPFPLIFGLLIFTSLSLGKLAFSRKPFLYPFGHLHLRFNAALHVYLRMAVSLPLPSWPHRHQTPSLSPFRADVVILQIQIRQGGVLFHGLGQGLEGPETRDLRNTMKHTAHRKTHYFPDFSFIRPCLDPSFAFLYSNSPHDTILTKKTKHQAFAPSGPMLFSNKNRSVRVEFSLRPLARAWQ